jgi:predicted Zn-dependent peptidase
MDDEASGAGEAPTEWRRPKLEGPGRRDKRWMARPGDPPAPPACRPWAGIEDAARGTPIPRLALRAHRSVIWGVLAGAARHPRTLIPSSPGTLMRPSRRISATPPLLAVLLVAVGAVGFRVAQAPGAAMAQAGDSGEASFAREEWGDLGIVVDELVLDNGFRLVIVEDRRVPRVAASLWYRLGALQEGPGEHGATHFLEHAIHQGTTTIGVRDPGLDRRLLEEIHELEGQFLAERSAARNQVRERRIFFDEEEWPTTPRMDSLQARILELEERQSENRYFWQEYNWYREAGGIMRHTDPVPANTGNELMRIEVDLPREHLELFFRMEADRMVNAVLRGFEVQRAIVLEQFLNINRSETGRFNEALTGISGIVHPIYLHPGGHMRDHAFWNRPSTIRMYEEYVVPNNAILALVGDIDAEEVRPLAEEYFGRIPRAPEPSPGMDWEAEPPPGGSIRLDWHEPLSPSLTVRYRTPGVGHPDRPAFDLVARLLGGADGMLVEAARDLGISSPGWSAGVNRNGSPTRLSIQARPSSDAELSELERVVEEAVERLRRGEVDETALARVQEELRFQWDRLRTHRGDLASDLGYFEVMDEWRTMRGFLEARESVSTREIQLVAARYLVPWNRIVGTTRAAPDPVAEGHLTSEPLRDPSSAPEASR